MWNGTAVRPYTYFIAKLLNGPGINQAQAVNTTRYQTNLFFAPIRPLSHTQVYFLQSTDEALLRFTKPYSFNVRHINKL